MTGKNVCIRWGADRQYFSLWLYPFTTPLKPAFCSHSMNAMHITIYLPAHRPPSYLTEAIQNNIVVPLYIAFFLPTYFLYSGYALDWTVEGIIGKFGAWKWKGLLVNSRIEATLILQSHPHRSTQ
jgi:hypothetical protein